MRQIGTIPNREEATRFTSFLLTRGIAARPEEEGDEWAIWVRDEDHVEEAAAQLELFRADPRDARYQTAQAEADRILRERARQRAAARKNIVEMRTQWDRAAIRRRPLTLSLLVLSVLVFILSNGGGSESSIVRMLRFNETTGSAADQSVGNKLASLLRGQVWRMITPIFLHFSVMHIVMNMICLLYFGSQIEHRLGTLMYGLLVLLIAALSNLGQALAPFELGGSGLGLFGGMSGVVYGLFGYIWMKMLFHPHSGLHVNQLTVVILVGWFFYCIIKDAFTEPGQATESIANWAHGMGLVVGMVAGYLPPRKDSA